MATTKKSAQERLTQFVQTSKALPPLRSKRGVVIMVGPIYPNNWGSQWSIRYREQHPGCIELCNTLDRLREEHRAANARHAFAVELRRLAKL